MNAADTERAYIAFLEGQLKAMETKDAETAKQIVLANTNAAVDARACELHREGATKARRDARFARADAARSRRMFFGAAIALSLSVAFNVFLVVARGWISAVLKACPLIALTFALAFPLFAEDENVRRVPPPVCSTVDIPTMKYAVTVPVANDFIRMTRSYVVTLSYYDGRSRHTQIKTAIAPQSQTQQLITEPTSVVFDVPVTFTNKRVAIQRLIVDSEETLP